MQQDETVSEMAQEALMRQVRALAQRSGYTLEDARQAGVDTQAGRQLRDLAQGEHRHQKAKQWQASVFWERAEERLMHQNWLRGPLALCSRTPLYSWVESYMERLEGKEKERAR